MGNGSSKRRFGQVLRRFTAFGDFWERSVKIENFEFLAGLGPESGLRDRKPPVRGSETSLKHQIFDPKGTLRAV